MPSDGGSPSPTLAINVNQTVTTRGGTTTAVVDRAIVRFDGPSTPSTPSTSSGTVSGTEGTLPKFQIRKGNTKIYIPQGGKDYAVVSSEGMGEMPVNFEAQRDGEYTITVKPEGVTFEYLHLIDNMTGADVDLLVHSVPEPVEGPNASPTGPSTSSGTSYTFTAKTTDYESRFKLVFCTNSDGPSTGSGTFAFINNGNIIINGEGTLQVVDVTGRVIVTRDAKHCVSTRGFVPGVYVLRLINGNDVKVQKIVVR